MRATNFILAAAFVAACTRDQHTPNVAAILVEKIDATAKCTPIFTDAGDQHVHSVACQLKEGWTYCAITHGQLGIVCSPLVQPPRTVAPAHPPIAEKLPEPAPEPPKKPTK